MSKIIDSIMFFNELDLLELRLEYLDSIVDTFVIVESCETFQKNPKPFYFEENKERFAKYLHKIVNYKIEDKSPFSHPIDVDIWQKNHITQAIHNLDLDEKDIIMISDCDEIPKKETLLQLIDNNDFTETSCMAQLMSYYYVNMVLKSREPWWGTIVLRYEDFIDWKTAVLDKQHNRPFVLDGGWHFSFLGGLDQIKKKIEAYGHKEYNNSYFKNENRLLNCILNGKDIFERNFEYEYVELDDSFPSILKEEKYNNFVLRNVDENSI